MATIATITIIAALALFFAAQAADRQIVRRPGTAAGANQEAKTALVVGNGDYKSSPLRNPVNDARVMARTLEALGFEVEKLENAGWREMSAAATEFGDRLMKGGVGLFYYAGHGMQYQGRNYLIPVDSDIGHEKEIPYKAVDAGLVLAQMENARNLLNVVVLDACRDNPFARGFRSAKSGLAYTDAPVGTLIAYATSPGKTAADGSGNHGLYTAELIRQMQTPRMGILEIFMNVRKNVRQKSGGRQIPWESTSLEGNFYFKPELDEDGGDGGTLVADSGGAVVETPSQTPTQAAPRLAASLSITSDAAGSTVWINGQKMAGSPPLNYPNIGPGRYRIKVGKDGYEPYERRVEVEAGRDYTVTAHLEKIDQGPAPRPAVPVSSTPDAGDVWREPATGMEFVWAPGGCYQMGSNDGGGDEKPVHEVCVDGFWMGRTEVTNAQYVAFLNSVGKRGTKSKPWFETEDEDSRSQITGGPGRFKVESGKDDYPAVNISWFGANAFVDWLNNQSGYQFRLPGEAEWEYACRSGGRQEKYAGGDDADRVAWYKGNSGGKTHPVGKKAANGLNLYDMSGNVWEWCLDIYDSSAYSKHQRNNPIYAKGASDIYAGGGGNRVSRGGSWYGSPAYVRCAIRYGDGPADRN